MKYSAFIPLTLSAAALSGAAQECAPKPPAQCNSDACCRMHCLGPKKYGVNAPVNPLTCNGDFEITLAGFYWKAEQAGLEYAIETQTINTTNTERHHLIDADFKNPKFKWDFGFKIGVGYNTTCDGWDIGLLWTRYTGRATSHNEAEQSDNQTLLVLWSDEKVPNIDSGDASFARDIETHWKFHLNLIDIALGRKYWNSHKVALRPHIGFRISYIDQDFTIEHLGGVLTSPTSIVNNQVKIDNDFKGVGIRTGLDGQWNVGCGFAIYGNFALSLNNGHFKVDHNEQNRFAESPFSKTKTLEAKNSFRATRLMTDLALGIQYSTLLCDCQYALSASLGWEQHLFLDQNQMWRVVRRQGSFTTEEDNIYHQRRGDLSTQGWTLTFVFDF